MKFCDQCGNTLKDNAKFCPACGTPVVNDEEQKPRTCSKCGELLEDGAVFCDNCGTRCNADPAQAKAAPLSVENRSMQPVNQERTQYISEYLGRAAILEKSLFTQNLTIEQVESQINSLGRPVRYSKPSLPWQDELHSDDFGSALNAGWYALIAGGIIGIFAGNIIGGAVLGAIIGFAGSLILKSLSISSENNRRDDEYQEDLKQYNYAVARDEKRVKAEKEEAKKLSSILQQMQEKRDETCSVLERFYDEDVVFPKYRNLVAVCSFYEYFASGRCSALTGHEGAYNIYENEARLERICTKLDEVIENLEQIKANQYFLYDAIQEGNQISQQLLQESVRQSRLAEQTAENTALAAHYSEIAANNAEACAWIGAANYLSIEDGKRRLND